MKKHRIKQYLLGIPVTLLILWGLYAATLQIIRWIWIKPRIQEGQAKAEKVLPLFLEDQAALIKVRRHLQSPRQKDAGPFLNPIVQLSTVPEPTTPTKRELRQALDRYYTQAKPARASLALPKEMAEQLQNLRDATYLEKYREFDLQGYDFSWMKTLREYDHWNFFKHSYFDYLENQTPGMIYEHPIPNFVSLIHWAKLRAIKGMQDHDITPALEEIRHLAKITYSTDILIGAMVSGSILLVENRTIEFYQRQNPHWQPLSPTMDSSLFEKFRRSVFALPGFGSSIFWRTRFDQVFEHKDYVGYCAALAEILHADVQMLPFSQEPQRNHYHKMKDLYLSGDCQINPLVPASWRTADVFQFIDEVEFAPLRTVALATRKLSWLPPTKTFIRELISGWGFANYFHKYQIEPSSNSKATPR